jgi:GntR family transcriptional regulator
MLGRLSILRLRRDEKEYLMPDVPAYLRIASDLRARIAAGDLQPGARIPSETALMQRYGVSRTVAKYAINVLKGEGLVEGRQGSGVYVREVRRLVRESHARDMRVRPGPTSPFQRDAALAGQRGSWEHHSAYGVADLEVAHRLAVDVGAPVMVTRYRFLADGLPIQLSVSYEPLALTRGTPVEWPEDGAAVGVVARFDTIGIRIDSCAERVTARSARPEEMDGLGLPLRGAYVLVIERTYHAAGRPVETADIVFPGDRYELVYRFPID